MSEQRLYDALKRIASYSCPDKLRRTSLKTYGLDPEEAIEMAYENVLQEAQNAIIGMRRPKDKVKKSAAATPLGDGGREA